MSTTTDKLALFKYDPSTDGAQTFNIKKALNDNWDKLDDAVKEILITLQNNDPRRWGIGGNAISIDSLDNAKETGVYKSGGIVCLSIAYSNGEVYQFRYTVSSHGFFEYQARYFLNSVWSPWEYINPRMEIGVEYRTTERYLGKPVYAMAVDLGAAPNATTKGITIKSSEVKELIFASFKLPSSEMLPYKFNGHEVIFNTVVYSSGELMVFITSNDDQSMMTVTGIVKYTKTTD